VEAIFQESFILSSSFIFSKLYSFKKLSTPFCMKLAKINQHDLFESFNNLSQSLYNSDHLTIIFFLISSFSFSLLSELISFSSIIKNKFLLNSSFHFISISACFDKDKIFSNFIVFSSLFHSLYIGHCHLYKILNSCIFSYQTDFISFVFFGKVSSVSIGIVSAGFSIISVKVIIFSIILSSQLFINIHLAICKFLSSGFSFHIFHKDLRVSFQNTFSNFDLFNKPMLCKYLK
jgi:hypothetical protein